MSFFKKIDSSIPLDKQDEKISDPFIYKDLNPQIYFVTDSLNKRQVSFIQNALQKIFKNEAPSFALLYAFTFKTKDKEITKDITSFMYNYTCDYSRYIPEWSKIICIGRAIYSFTWETTFNATAFYPYDYVDTYFFHPKTKSYVFPVDDFFYFSSFEEKRFLDNFNSFFFFNQIKRAEAFVPKKVRLPELKVVMVEDPNIFLLEMKDKVKEVAWDLETSGLIYYKSSIICITMSFDGITGYYLDFSKVDLQILNEFFKDKYQIGANLKFDCKFLRNLGVTNAKIDFDTLNAGHCLNETVSNSLSSHGWRYTYYGGHEIELHRYKKKHPKLKSYAQIPKSILSQYAAKDAIICYQAYKKELSLLEEDPLLYSYYFKEVVPNLNLFLEIELDGVLIDWKYLEELKKSFEEKKLQLAEEIYEELGFRVNLTSNKDLSEALESVAKLPDIGMTAKNGSFLTNEEALSEWSKLGYTVADKIIAFRSTCNQINTFIGDEETDNAYWKFKNDLLGTVHPTYSVMLAQSHRNKCSSPNLQQVPKRTTTATDFRKIFIPPSNDYFMAEGDYSSFQMRIAAILSGDQNLKDAFTKYGGDIHSMTAVAIFHKDMSVEQFMKLKHESPYKEQRGIGKGTNFAFLFGGSAFAFSDNVLRKEWSQEYCENFIRDKHIRVNFGSDIYYAAGEYIRNSYFEKYPKLKEWHEKCHEEAKQTGMIRTAHGARRLLPRLTYIGKDTDKKTISEDQNISKNSPVQNFEAVSIMRGMREFNELAKKNNWKSRIFGMIHDAVEFYIYKDERSFIVKQILDIFQKMYDEYNGVIMKFELELADPELGEVWGFGEEVEE